MIGLFNEMKAALEAAEKADEIHSDCEECNEYGQAAEVCEKCFPSADVARVLRRNVLAAIKKADRAKSQSEHQEG